MNLQVFRSFIKTAVALQVDASDETPRGYHETRAAVRNCYPDLERPDHPDRVVPEIEPYKMASTARHLIELGGLGTLAAPSIQELRHKPMSEKSKAGLEVAGLGALAAPYAYDLARAHGPSPVRSMLSRLGHRFM